MREFFTFIPKKICGRARESARVTQCLSNLRQIGMAYSLYLADNKQLFPPYWDSTVMPSRLNAIMPYTGLTNGTPVKGVFACPEAQKTLARLYSNTCDRNSFHQNRHWASLNNSPSRRKSLMSFVQPSQAILVYERWGAADLAAPEPNTNLSVRNVLFVDFHVRSRADLAPLDALNAACRVE
jgi:prepilin-type processing-associated H-X9-DG protein